MVRKMAYVGFSYLLGLLFASFFCFEINIIIAVIIVLTGCILCLAGRKFITVCVCFICFGTGTLFYSLYDYHVYNSIVKYDGSDVVAEGVITSFSLKSGDMCSYEVTGTINGDVKADIICFGQSVACRTGDNITITGKISKPDKTYLFDSESYYKGKGIFLEMSYPESIHITDGNRFLIKRKLLEYRDHIYRRMDKYLTVDQMATVKAILFGDKTSLDDTTKTLLYRAGIGHIMAVSGVHLTIISSVMWFVLSQFPLNKYVRFALLCAVIVIFVILSGASNSVVRAAVMLFIVYSGNIFYRSADTMNSLGIAALLLTFDCPFAVRDASFLLSFAGVIGISIAAPAVIDVFERKRELHHVIKAFIVSASVSATVFPVSFLFFDEVSVVSPFSNVLLMPFCTVILICGMIVTCTGGVSFIAFPVLKLCGVCCNIVEVTATVIGRMNYSYVPMGYEFTGILIAAAFVVILTVLIIFRKKSVVLLSSVTVFMVCTAAIMCYRFIPSDHITVALIGNGKGSSSIVIHDNRSASIIDLHKGGRSHEYIKKYLNKRGIFIIDMLVMGVDDNTSPVTYRNSLDLFDIRTVVLKDSFIEKEFAETLADNVLYYDDTVDQVIDMPDYSLLISEDNTVYVQVNGIKIISYNSTERSGISGKYDIAIAYAGNKPAKYIECDTFIAYDEKCTVPQAADNSYCGTLYKIRIYDDHYETEAIE